MRSTSFKGDFYKIKSVAEDMRYIYLACDFYCNSSLGRPGVLFDKCIDKGSQRGFAVVNSFGNEGFVDDILRGPVFWPYVIADQYYVSVVEPNLLLEVNDGLVNPGTEYKKFIQSLDEDKSNTIVILAKRK